MTQLYPLRFQPILRRYLWGGRRLASLLGKDLRPGDDFAESWEVVDRPGDQSVVAAGHLQGRTLRDLLDEHGAELLGRHHPQARFPLLLKFLDARQRLSLQVHPNDAQAAALQPPDLGKTEAWVVVAADRESMIYAGLKRGVDRAGLESAIARGTVEECLNRIEPRAGDCLFVPAGLVHALGAGLVVAEIQQSSDTTFRLFDWNRAGPDGRPRPLHVEQALEVIDFDYGPAAIQQPQATDRPHVARLVSCDKFVLDRWQFDAAQPIGGDDRFHLLAVLGGAVRVAGDPSRNPLKAGGTVLLPASLGAVSLTPMERTTLLDTYLPSESS